MRRVAITGMGAISCIGLDADATWASMLAGRCGIGPISGVQGPALLQPIAGQVHGFDAGAHFDAKRLALLDRVSAFAVVTVREALLQSGLQPRQDGLAARMAVIVGTGVGGEGKPRPAIAPPVWRRWSRASAGHTALHGQRAGCPHQHGIRHHGAGLLRHQRLCFIQSRAGPGLPDGAHRAGGSGDLGRHRRLHHLRHAQGLGSDARDGR